MRFESGPMSVQFADVSEDTLRLLCGGDAQPPTHRVEVACDSEPAYVRPPTKRRGLTGKRYRIARRAWRRRRRAWVRDGSPMDLHRLLIPAATVTEVPGAPGTFSVGPVSVPSQWHAPAPDPYARPVALGKGWTDVGYYTED